MEEEIFTLEETTNYLNQANIGFSVDSDKVIWLSVRGAFPAYNYLQYQGDEFYKISGIQIMFKNTYTLDCDELGKYIVRPGGGVFGFEECNALVGKFTTRKTIMPDKAYEIDVRTEVFLECIAYSNELDKGEFPFRASLYKIRTPFSELDSKGKFNGLVKSPFTEALKKRYLPTSNIIREELKSIIDHLIMGTLEVYLFSGVFFDISLDLECTMGIREDDLDIDKLFYFRKKDIDDYIAENNTKLKARIEQQEQNTEQMNEQEHDSKEYSGDRPLSTNEDKLAYFIDLLIEASPELQKDGHKPTYSELHTILRTKLRNKKIPSKATIQKYMNQI